MGSRGRCRTSVGIGADVPAWAASALKKRPGAHFIKWNGMGQKGSKARDTKPKTPASTGCSPLNNATYWEAEEDPDWDNCVMVVATQKGRRYPTLTSACSTDSLARSLHKEVDYSPVNVSRRSPDHNTSPMAPLAPDSKYPTPGQRKRQNTVLDTGWHACFKNNNYVFVRNTNGDVSGQFGEKWKENNDSNVTFIISTTKPIHEGKEEKLVVSLSDPKSKVRRCTPSPPPCEDLPTKKTPKTDSSKNGILDKRSEKKRTPNWLRRLRNSGRNRPLKVEASEEETTLILGANTGESPGAADSAAPTETKSRISPTLTHTSDCSSSSHSLKEPENQTRAPSTPVLGSTQDLTVRGLQTSTPKDQSEKVLRNVPRKSGTPYRPLDARLSVRRRLPYDSITPETKSNFLQTSIVVRSPTDDLLTGVVEGKRVSPSLEIPISPIKRSVESSQSGKNCKSAEGKTDSLQRRASCFHNKGSSDSKDNNQANAVLERRDSCLQPDKNLGRGVVDKPPPIPSPVGSEKHSTEAPKVENRLHPSSSNTDIPFADSDVDVSFDDRRSRRITKQRVAAVKTSKSAADVSCQGEGTSEQKAKSVPYFTSVTSIILSPDAKCLSHSEPCISVKKKQLHTSPMEDEENTSLEHHEKQLLICEDSTLKEPTSPMEEEENRDLLNRIRSL
ncbi:hypothetical protein AVEN_132431-1 [Araneus ventricosus]|uniref:Uncharacterized protein n=1 Tax=Araneus ventricosus TaxID=182803 RepID=A0A4Y2IGQ0_ARAVE|nr:hypothetical protein AVEN_132431-1 [Araneus ventricosus]